MTLEATLEVTVDGGAVVFDFRAVNAGLEPVELTFTSGKVADVAVYEGDTASGEPRWRWSDGMMFTQAIQRRTLEAGDDVTREFTWEGPPEGEYVARGTLAADETVEAETTFAVR